MLVLCVFVLRYPLGSKRLQQHLTHFIKNLGYSREDGRMTVLDMLHSIVLKLPLPILEQQAQLFFLPLVLRLVGDTSPTCRAAAGTVIKLLVRRVGDKVAVSLLEIVLRWYNADQSVALRRTAAQAAGLFVDVRSDVVSAHYDKLVVHVKREVVEGGKAAAALVDAGGLSGGSSPGDEAEPGADVDTAFHSYEDKEVPLDDGGQDDDDDGWTTVPEGGGFAVLDASGELTVTSAAGAGAGAGTGAGAGAGAAEAKNEGGDDDGWVTVPEGGGFAVVDADGEVGVKPANGDAGGDSEATLSKSQRKKKNRPLFIASPSFTGRRKGYVFYNGDQGIGYYLDSGCATANADDTNTGADDGGSHQWQIAYYSLVCLEKLLSGLASKATGLLEASASTNGRTGRGDGPKSKRKRGSKRKQQAESNAAASVPSLLPSVVDLLVYPHSWVRLASSRVLGSVLARLVCVGWCV